MTGQLMGQDGHLYERARFPLGARSRPFLFLTELPVHRKHASEPYSRQNGL